MTDKNSVRTMYLENFTQRNDDKIVKKYLYKTSNRENVKQNVQVNTMQKKKSSKDDGPSDITLYI